MCATHATRQVNRGVVKARWLARRAQKLNTFWNARMQQRLFAFGGAASHHQWTRAINAKFARQVIGKLLRIFKRALLRRVSGLINCAWRTSSRVHRQSWRDWRGVPLHGAAYMHALRWHAHEDKSIGVQLSLRGYK